MRPPSRIHASQLSKAKAAWPHASAKLRRRGTFCDTRAGETVLLGAVSYKGRARPRLTTLALGTGRMAGRCTHRALATPTFACHYQTCRPVPRGCCDPDGASHHDATSRDAACIATPAAAAREPMEQRCGWPNAESALPTQSFHTGRKSSSCWVGGRCWNEQARYFAGTW